jgi:hypothetical protein
MSDDEHPELEGYPPFPPKLSDVGLPVGRDLGIHTVSYNKAAATFVVVLQPPNLINSGYQRVFVRGPGESVYREIALPDALAHVSDTVVCSESPSVFLNIMKWSSAERRGSNYLGLYRASLPDGVVEKLPQPTDPITAPQFVDATTILGASPDGSELHLIVTIPIYVARAPGGHSMGFFLATYATDSGIVKILDEVPAVFA